jgi:hypothetical protein
MSDLFCMCLELTFGSGRLEHQTGQLFGAAFAASCAIFTFMVLLLDLCVLYIRRKSFLQLSYSLWQGAGLLLVVPAAAGLVGLFGLYLEILQASRAACIAVGFGWPFLLAAFFNVREGIGPGREDPDNGGKALS